MRRQALVLVGLLGACRADAPTSPSASANNGDQAATTVSTLGAKSPSEALALLPTGPSEAVGVDLDQIVTSPVWPQLQSNLDSETRAKLVAIGECGVGPGTWRHGLMGFVLGGDSASLVLEAQNLGRRNVLGCLEGVFGPFELSSSGRSLSYEDGGGVVLDDDAIALASSDWLQRLHGRVVGKGAQIDGTLAEAVARIPPGKALWFAGVADARYINIFAMVGMRFLDYSVWVEVHDGMTIRLTLGVDDANVAHETLRTKWSSYKEVAKGWAPAAVVDGVKFSTERSWVHIDIDVPRADVGAVVAPVVKLVAAWFAPADFSNARPG